MDAGFGLEWSQRLFWLDLRLRVDIPFYVNDTDQVSGSGSAIDFNRWVFSFQPSL